MHTGFCFPELGHLIFSLLLFEFIFSLIVRNRSFYLLLQVPLLLLARTLVVLGGLVSVLVLLEVNSVNFGPTGSLPLEPLDYPSHLYVWHEILYGENLLLTYRAQAIGLAKVSFERLDDLLMYTFETAAQVAAWSQSCFL